MSGERIDVLSVIDVARTLALSDHTRRDLSKVRAAVAELIAAAHRAEVSFNTVRACYERNPGNFMVAMRVLDDDVSLLRSALARIGGDA